MKRIPTQKNSFIKRLLINLPFVAMVLCMIAAFGGSLLFLFYTIVTAIAFKSAMVSLIVLGAALILLGIGLLLIPAFKKYYDFYNKKMGWQYVLSEKEQARLEKKQNAETEAENKTVVGARKISLKKIFSLSNISIAFLALGSVFSVISAALGCIDRDEWVKTVGAYRVEKGYYADVRNEPVRYFLPDENIKEIVVDCSKSPELADRKKVVVNYFDYNEETMNDWGYMSIGGYKKFADDFTVSINRTEGVITISIGVPPKRDSALDKLLFFVFNDYNAEKQIFISIPSDYKDLIDIVCFTAIAD